MEGCIGVPMGFLICPAAFFIFSGIMNIILPGFTINILGMEYDDESIKAVRTMGVVALVVAIIIALVTFIGTSTTSGCAYTIGG